MAVGRVCPRCQSPSDSAADLVPCVLECIRVRLICVQVTLRESPHAQSLAFQSVLKAEGLTGALRYLNALTPYRFTGLFALEGDSLRNIALVDRVEPAAPTWAPFHKSKSYCSLVIASNSPFETRDAMADDRVTDHAARTSVRSYCGVPLMNPEGRAMGTLCHLDYAPQAADAAVDLEFMLELPQLLTPYLPAR